MLDKPEYPWIKDMVRKKGYTQASREGWYNTTAWRKLREYKISNSPLCSHCLKVGKVNPADMIDHIEPLTGTTEKDWELFLKYDNLQSLCNSCHAKKTRRDNSKYSDANLKRGEDIMKSLEE